MYIMQLTIFVLYKNVLVYANGHTNVLLCDIFDVINEYAF